MSVKIISETENKLLNRKEIVARITYEGITPNRDAVKDLLKIKGNVVIRKIEPEYGRTSALVHAVSYADKKFLETVEAKHITKKNFKEVKVEASE